jgi:hypothetical protein
MRSSVLLSLGSVLALALLAPAQACTFYPTDTPASGTPDPRPFGNGNPLDPAYGTMRYQIQVPTSVLGAQPLDIRQISVAPAGTSTRTFTELQLRMGHNPNPLTTQMVFNLVGFTANPVQLQQLTFSTVADQWLSLGMAQPFHYNPANGMLVLEFYVRQAGAVLSAGNSGFRTDPAIPFVWTSGSGYNGTIVAGGGIKVRFCTDAYGFIEYGDGGCVGSTNLTPHLSYSGSAQVGNTINIHLTDAPPMPNTAAVLIFSFRPRGGPLDLGGYGAPGCKARVFGDVASWLFTSNGTLTTSIPLPPGLVPGLTMWNQWFVFDPPANALGVISSNFGDFMIGS